MSIDPQMNPALGRGVYLTSRIILKLFKTSLSLSLWQCKVANIKWVELEKWWSCIGKGLLPMGLLRLAYLILDLTYTMHKILFSCLFINPTILKKKLLYLFFVKFCFYQRIRSQWTHFKSTTLHWHNCWTNHAIVKHFSVYDVQTKEKSCQK